MTSTPRRDPNAFSEDTMTSQTLQPDLLMSGVEPAARAATPRALRPLSPVPTVVGVLVAAVGLLLIIIAWSEVAGEGDVARQIPYLVSGGIFGLAVVQVGLLIINVASKRRETALREQQAQRLSEAVAQLGHVLQGERRLHP